MTLLQELHELSKNRFDPEKIAHSVFNTDYVQNHLIPVSKDAHGDREARTHFILDRLEHLVAGKHDLTAYQFMEVMDELHELVFATIH